jgi:peptidoglycan hydrolase-like protein with peptidoglycan-binding domain
LKEQGHPISVDGKWGPRTAAALRDFQAANNLSATGKLNTETMAALNIR